MMQSFISTFISLLTIFLAAADNNGTVRGRITDKSSGEPLAGVYVIYGKNLGTTSDEEGFYQFSSAPGRVSVMFHFVGYESATFYLTLKQGEVFDLNVSLEMKVREMDQVVISADKIEKRIAELSVSMDVIKNSFLSSNHLTNSQEIINKTTGIEVLDGQASIRGGSGFSYGAGSRVMALTDGLPMLSADAGNIKWQYIPLENISQIEIIKGASSVLYGSSALNGIINFRTADASNIPVTRFFTEGGIYDHPKNRDWKWWDKPRVFSTLSFSHLQKSGKTDIGLGTNLFINENYRRLNDDKLGRVTLKLKHHGSRIEGLSYGVTFNGGYNYKTDFLLWEDAETGALKQSPATAGKFRGTFVAADPVFTFKKPGRFQHDLRSRVQATTNRMPDHEQNNSDAISFYSEYQLWTKLTDFMDLTAGLSENYAIVKSRFFNDHNSLNLAGYGQFDLRPAKKLKAVAGVRLEHYSLDSKSNKLVPILRTGLNWQAGASTYIRASYGQGYRFPSMAEKFAATTMGSIKIIANPYLKPESGWSGEIGIKQGIMSGSVTGGIDFSTFMLNNRNLVEYMFGIYPEGQGFMAVNLEQARVYGFEMELLLSSQHGPLQTSLSGGYTFMYPVEVNRMTGKNTGTYLKYRRKHSAIINLENTFKKFSLNLNLYLKSKTLNIDDVFLNTPVLPGFNDYWARHNTGYSTLDISTAYELGNKFTLSLALKNAFNTEYMGRPGDIQPPRNISLRLSGKL